MNIHDLVRKNILELIPYQSARKLIHSSGKIWLNANEYPTAPNYTLRYKNIHRYPMCQPTSIINSYATYAGVKKNQVLVSRGSDESIELLMKIFCNPQKDYIIICPPTYGMYKTTADILGINCKIIPTKKNWQLDIQSITSQLNNVKLIYICHPNNPTGNIIHLNSLKKLLKIINNRALLISDEAYIDFYPTASLTNWLSKYSHLIILRTLSKAFALAGLRCGFTLAHPDIIKLLNKVITPYPLPLPVIDIVEQALNPKEIKNTQNKIKIIHENRETLVNELKKFPCVQKIFDSKTNYILVKFDPKYQVFQSLLEQGIVLRDQSYQLGLSNCLRITIGTYYECQQIISTLNKINCLFPST